MGSFDDDAAGDSAAHLRLVRAPCPRGRQCARAVLRVCDGYWRTAGARGTSQRLALFARRAGQCVPALRRRAPAPRAIALRSTQFQEIMACTWRRINESGKNWRVVYKVRALAVVSRESAPWGCVWCDTRTAAGGAHRRRRWAHVRSCGGVATVHGAVGAIRTLAGSSDRLATRPRSRGAGDVALRRSACALHARLAQPRACAVRGHVRAAPPRGRRVPLPPSTPRTSSAGT